MIRCTFKLVGASPISFGRPIVSKKNTGEKPDDFEERTWRERCHVDDRGELFIPPMALKNCLSEVAQYLGESVPGKKCATYTKHFVAGLLVTDPMPLGVKLDDVEGNRVFVPSDGKRGGGKRVWKIFPIVRSWKTHATVYIADPAIKPDKLLEYLEHAGKFIGMGVFRPRNNGYFGRWTVEDFKSSET